MKVISIFILVLTTIGMPAQSETDNFMLFADYREVDEIDAVKYKLDGMVKFLQASPQYDAWILSYGGKRACVAEARQRAEITKRYLLSKGISSERITVVDAGFHEVWLVEFWVVIHGTPGPIPNPSVKPDAVRIINRTKRQPYKCRKLKDSNTLMRATK